MKYAVIKKIKTEYAPSPEIQDFDDTHCPQIRASEIEGVVMGSLGPNRVSNEHKIYLSDCAMKKALESEDVVQANKMLEVALHFLSHDPIHRKPSVFMCKYALIVFKKSFEFLSDGGLKDMVIVKFRKFYRHILSKMDVIDPDSELLIVEILSMIDLRFSMKYLSVTMHQSICIQSFQFVVNALLSHYEYQPVVAALINYIICSDDEWILKFIGNELLRHSLKYDFGVTLNLLIMAMELDIEDGSSSFIEFAVIQDVIKAVHDCAQKGDEHRTQFLNAQLLFLQNYSPNHFDPVPGENELHWLLMSLIQINTQIYKSWLDAVL